MNDVIVRLVPMPAGSDGYVLEDPAGDYNVYISDELGSIEQRQTYVHELIHIKKGHLRDHELTAAECESIVRDELRCGPELRSESVSVVVRITDGFNISTISQGN